MPHIGHTVVECAGIMTPSFGLVLEIIYLVNTVIDTVSKTLPQNGGDEESSQENYTNQAETFLPRFSSDIVKEENP